jgi:predicted glycosyltransferase
VRDLSQLQHYTQTKFSGINVPEKPLPFEDVASTCKLFIGAGGSMTREMAIIGIPTISVYQGELLEVDKFLITEKLMVYEPKLKLANVEDLMVCDGDEKVNMKLIEKGKVAYKLFKTELLKYNK